ncbi:hypothetical protein KP509_39G054400 [Ceratopteris richardii]|uniref:Molybdopterin synthase sulfur carrier subunit n=1 Tax=Ceratopteris richardii TaxID=49495 RepID=A0A8T2Q1E1_CERRI|nr:hypothetical protein KP509_39G054400 [Ceratopteris richardii]KAH7277501.1 hypothetical protein KP509_39G054400 [Ceratopteris richardii]
MDAEFSQTEGTCGRVKVLFFARAREIAGVSETSLGIDGAESSKTIKDCIDLLTKQFPGLEEIMSCIVVALNQEYADQSSLVKSGDELALIPPISGG